MLPPKIDTSTDPQVGFRPPGTLDAAGALLPYTGRFAPRQAAHLLRRAGFGGSEADVARLAALGMQGAVDTLLHPAAPDASLPDYPDVASLYDPKKARQTAQLWWLDRMLRTNRPLVEKMVLFWHGHFATSVQKVQPPQMVAQISLFRQLGLGRFPVLLSAVTRDPAMRAVPPRRRREQTPTGKDRPWRAPPLRRSALRQPPRRARRSRIQGAWPA